MSWRGLACLLAVLGPSSVAGQAPADSVAHFLQVATDASRRYADRAVAVREGFRRVGPDSPAWASTGCSLGAW